MQLTTQPEHFLAVLGSLLIMAHEDDFYHNTLRVTAFLRVVGNMPERPARYRQHLRKVKPKNAAGSPPQQPDIQADHNNPAVQSSRLLDSGKTSSCCITPNNHSPNYGDGRASIPVRIAGRIQHQSRARKSQKMESLISSAKNSIHQLMKL